MGKFKNFLILSAMSEKQRIFQGLNLLHRIIQIFSCGATEHMIPTPSELALMRRLSDSRSYPLNI
jgi:hypothetical protein